MAAQKKQYASTEVYEKKLAKVMARFGVDQYNWDFTRQESWVEFNYHGALYRFDHDIHRAREAGCDLRYGSDVFAQLVLALEDLARIVERGIYQLDVWVAGMKSLPAGTGTKMVATCYQVLGFVSEPESEEAIKKAFRDLAKTAHPDKGGSADEFQALNQAYEEALRQWKSRHPNA